MACLPRRGRFLKSGAGPFELKPAGRIPAGRCSIAPSACPEPKPGCHNRGAITVIALDVLRPLNELRHAQCPGSIKGERNKSRVEQH